MEPILKAWWLGLITNLKVRLLFLCAGMHQSYWVFSMEERVQGCINNAKRGKEFGWLEWW